VALKKIGLNFFCRTPNRTSFSPFNTETKIIAEKFDRSILSRAPGDTRIAEYFGNILRTDRNVARQVVFRPKLIKRQMSDRKLREDFESAAFDRNTLSITNNFK